MMHSALPISIFIMALFQPIQIDPFVWLQGTWSMARPDGSQRLEIWNVRDETTLYGKGLNVKGSDTLLLENLQLLFKNNNYWYIPTVPDQNQGQPVLFELKSHDRKVFVFENLHHDFPQRIVYHFKPIPSLATYHHSGIRDTLDVRVEDINGDGFSFRFFRQ